MSVSGKRAAKAVAPLSGEAFSASTPPMSLADFVKPQPHGMNKSTGSPAFRRQWSHGSTAVPDTPAMTVCEDPHDLDHHFHDNSRRNTRMDTFELAPPMNFGTPMSSERLVRLENTLAEVKALYNEKYPLDHVDIVGQEIGQDSDGLLWVQYTGQGPHPRGRLMARLAEVKTLYNAKYPEDHVDAVDQEIGRDSEGLLWVQYNGQGLRPLHRLECELTEVRELYNQKYPEDHVDAVDQELGRDSDGLLWVKYIGQQETTPESHLNRLEHRLEEVKAMYNRKYPLDHADAIDQQVGRDADGLLWVQYNGQGLSASQRLSRQLAEVKELYNQKYPLDHVDAVDQELGRDSEGLLWVQYNGQGLRPQHRLECKLAEVRELYNQKYPQDHVDAVDQELGRDSDGLLWVKYIGQQEPTLEARASRLEHRLKEVKAMYNRRYPLDHVDVLDQEVGRDADGLLWVRFTGQGLPLEQRLRLELEEVKALYNQRYPMDHIDAVDQELGRDADGLLWVRYTGQGVRPIQKLENLLAEVKDLYNKKYPLDHVDAVDQELGRDADGLLWVRYSGGLGAEHLRQRRIQRLETMLAQVKALYNKRYPLDHIDAVGQEVGRDADGMLWVRHTGQGVSSYDRLMRKVEEVKSLYNKKYPLDHVDAVDQEVGIDSEGLLWVKYSGQGLRQVHRLECLLAEVKTLYNSKYPLDHVDVEGQEIGRDEDGLLWVRYSGREPTVTTPNPQQPRAAVAPRGEQDLDTRRASRICGLSAFLAIGHWFKNLFGGEAPPRSRVPLA